MSAALRAPASGDVLARAQARRASRIGARSERTREQGSFPRRRRPQRSRRAGRSRGARARGVSLLQTGRAPRHVVPRSRRVRSAARAGRIAAMRRANAARARAGNGRYAAAMTKITVNDHGPLRIEGTDITIVDPSGKQFGLKILIYSI